MDIRNLKVAILPLSIEWGNKEKNFETVADAVATVESDTDLVVLPELFTTAFLPDKDMMGDVAEPLSGQTLQFVRELAKRYNVAMAGSFLAGVGGLYYNRGFFVEPSGEETIYDKKHLFSLSQEYRISGRRRQSSSGSPFPWMEHISYRVLRSEISCVVP